MPAWTEARTREAALAQAQRDEPARFDAFAERIAALGHAHPRADPAGGRAEPRTAGRRAGTRGGRTRPARRSAWPTTRRRRVSPSPSCYDRAPSRSRSDATMQEAVGPCAAAELPRCWLRPGRLRRQTRAAARRRTHAQEPGRPQDRASPRTPASRAARNRRSPPTASSSRRHRTRRSAPRRCAAWATWRWTAPTARWPAAKAADDPRTTAPPSPATRTS